MENENTYSGVKEIARRAKVSIATVDRVLHNRTGVSEKTKKRINEIIKELNYQPNILASRLASKKVISIGVLIPAVSEETDFWEAPLRGIRRAESEIRQYGIQVHTFLFDLNNKRSFQEQSDLLLKTGVSGVLIAPSFIEEASTFAQECKRLKIPVICIDSNLPDTETLSYIGPHLSQSGYVGARLLTYRLQPDRKILFINISPEKESYNYIRIEEGFRSYFKDHNQLNDIVRIDLRDTDFLSVSKALLEAFQTHSEIGAIFVTNSRVFTIAKYLQEKGLTDIGLVGYDFIKENVVFLQNGTIDFLICHKPEDQGYRGVMSLYQNLVLGTSVEKAYFMPIDIVTKENEAFYQN
ncbi:transcriptional regulator [Dyadobacter luteus]|uniref:Transcriptional regulator n=1 Tax=Dyadobacter luteus TaxID=2259619 RepID=A0A3D8Y7K5_9BACT|nr:LacI family DNA-binding transcriptional regulator [Dyadobacter luteus]REA59011.1 transcriptional regulator [Dyadobacter luteus]